MDVRWSKMCYNISNYCIVKCKEKSMTREDFMNELRSVLSGEVSQSVLNENIQYYEQYFNEQERKGRNIEEVLGELGSPRLIARTIIDTSDKVVGEEETFYQQKEEFNDDIHINLNGKEYRRSVKKARVAIWMIVVIALLLIIAVVAVVANVIGFLAPVLVPLLLIALAIRLITRNQ